MHSKFTYFARSLCKRMADCGNACPFCGASQSSRVDSKYWVTTLQRCGGCRLLFRQPTTTEQESQHFYDENYSQGFTTTLPTQSDLQRLMVTKFAHTEKDYSVYLDVLTALGVPQGSRIIDFGCSWGYGTWQMRAAGYDVIGVEVGSRRRRYACEKLGLHVVEALDRVSTSYDVFFSAHVLEHVPALGMVLGQAFDRLRDQGLFVAFTPNGCRQFREAHPRRWRRMWGAVHPQLLDDEFYDTAFDSTPKLLAAAPYDIPALQNESVQDPAGKKLCLSGHELLCVVRKVHGHKRWGEPWVGRCD